LIPVQAAELAAAGLIPVQVVQAAAQLIPEPAVVQLIPAQAAAMSAVGLTPVLAAVTQVQAAKAGKILRQNYKKIV
jgi:hypothetical protein